MNFNHFFGVGDLKTEISAENSTSNYFTNAILYRWYMYESKSTELEVKVQATNESLISSSA